MPVPPLVPVGCERVGGHVGRPCTALAPRLPLFLALRLEGACVQQRLLERQERLVLFDTNFASAQPVPPPLPPLVCVHLIWATGGAVARLHLAARPTSRARLLAVLPSAAVHGMVWSWRPW